MSRYRWTFLCLLFSLYMLQKVESIGLPLKYSWFVVSCLCFIIFYSKKIFRCAMLFNLRDIMLSRYLSLLIIEVRLKSQQQRDSFYFVYYTARHNLTVRRGFTGRSLAAPLLFIRLFLILLLLSSVGDRNARSCKSRLTATSRG